MNILIGSRALQYYGMLEGREPADWDLIAPGDNPKTSFRLKDGTLVEIDSEIQDGSYTNRFFYQYSLYASNIKAQTPVGEAIVAPKEVLLALKLACVKYLSKAKHQWDLERMVSIWDMPDAVKRASQEREKEIADRVEKQKRQFFDKYKIQRIVDHDRLHQYVNPEPIYTRVLADAVNIDPKAFDLLGDDDKRCMFWEEAMVLGLERELFPKMHKAPWLARHFYNQFKKVQNSNDAAYRWISRLSVRGALKDHPDWLADWAMAQGTQLFNGLRCWWVVTLNQLPKDLWIEILHSKDQTNDEYIRYKEDDSAWADRSSDV
jgi:hypothetical protein